MDADQDADTVEGSLVDQDAETVLPPPRITLSVSPETKERFSRHLPRAVITKSSTTSVIFGRGKNADVMLNSSYCSREHAELGINKREATGFWLKSRTIKSQLLVNDEALGKDSRPLGLEDRIRIDDLYLKVEEIVLRPYDHDLFQLVIRQLATNSVNNVPEPVHVQASTPAQHVPVSVHLTMQYTAAPMPVNPPIQMMPPHPVSLWHQSPPTHILPNAAAGSRHLPHVPILHQQPVLLPNQIGSSSQNDLPIPHSNVYAVGYPVLLDSGRTEQAPSARLQDDGRQDRNSDILMNQLRSCSDIPFEQQKTPNNQFDPSCQASDREVRPEAEILAAAGEQPRLTTPSTPAGSEWRPLDRQSRLRAPSSPDTHGGIVLGLEGHRPPPLSQAVQISGDSDEISADFEKINVEQFSRLHTQQSTDSEMSESIVLISMADESSNYDAT